MDTETSPVLTADPTGVGSVTNLAQGALMGQWPLSVWSLRREGVEQCGRSAALGFFLDLQLFFRDHVHAFDPDQSILSRIERFTESVAGQMAE